MSQTDMVLVENNVTLAMPTILPKSWICTNLGRVIEYGKVDKAEPDNISDNTWVLELADIEKDSSAIIQRLNFHDRQSKSTKNKFKKGDVLYSKLRPYLNKVIVADSSGVCTTEIIPLSSGANLNNRYLFYWLKHPIFLAYVNAVGYGVNMPRLGTKDGIAAPFVLAPLAEQQQIAAKLDELLGQVDIIKARLDTAPKILKRFRQSVLAAAVNGELTEAWRENKGLKIDWKESRLGDVVKIDRGSSPRPIKQYITESDNGVNWIKIGDAGDSDKYITSTQEKITKEGAKKSRHVLPGDFILSNSMSLGRAYIMKIEGYVHDGWFVLRLPHYINSDFFYYLLSSSSVQDQFTNLAVGGVVKNIRSELVKQALVKIPVLEEQIEIAGRIEQLFAFADQVEQRVKDAHKRVNYLTQAILAKAFSGELTADWRAQNPDLISGENSAEALLAKIKAEREALAKCKPTKPRIKKKAGESMNPQNIMPIIEALKAAGQPLSSQDLLAQAGYPGNADTDQLEIFFLDIREQLNAKTITRERKGDKEFFAIAE